MSVYYDGSVDEEMSPFEALYLLEVLLGMRGQK